MVEPIGAIYSDQEKYRKKRSLINTETKLKASLNSSKKTTREKNEGEEYPHRPR